MTPFGPRPFVEQMVRDLPPGRALDLACGTGRNALWLVDRGWKVVGVDSSASAIATLRQSNPAIEAHIADLERHEFQIEESAWDLIVVSYYLQRDLFAPILRALRPDGLAVIIVHMFEPGRESSRFSVAPGELRQAFAEETIVEYREGKPASDPNGRAIAQIAVRHHSRRHSR
ncbi:MAG: methyltransferase domain-containing protein [Acidobacteriota bacterium]